jgi:hypothetical protein
MTLAHRAVLRRPLATTTVATPTRAASTRAPQEPGR